MTVKEYNTKHLSRINAAKIFLHALPHAMQKSGAYEEAMHQLRCIGWSDELVQTFKDALNCYHQSLLDQLKDERNNNISIIEYYNNKLREKHGNNISVVISKYIGDNGAIYYYYTTKNCGRSDLMRTMERAYESADEYLGHVGE